MSSIIRFSGYFVSRPGVNKFDFLSKLFREFKYMGHFQQLHVDIKEHIEIQGEDTPNCDLALLTRHFKLYEDTALESDRPLPKEGEKYKHFKTGKVVTIVGIGRHTESEELEVIYKYNNDIWVRPLKMFMNETDLEKYPRASQVYRFEKVEDNKDE